MKVTILGSGTGIPSLERCAAGYLLHADQQKYLIDCGTGILRQLEQDGLGFNGLDAVFITHTHSDHIGDLTAMIHALRMPGLQREKPLNIFGPPGFSDFFNDIVVPVAKTPDKFPFFVKEAPTSWLFATTTITTCPTIHSNSFASIAYRFEKNRKTVVFSGDCDLDPEIVALSDSADLLICDCSTLHAEKIKGHLSAKEVGQLATKAQVKHLIPSHFYPIPGPESSRKKECAQHFPGKITMARDLLTVTA